MSRAVLITDIDTSLGNELVRLFLETGDRVFATSSTREALSSFKDVARDSLHVYQWNRRSPVSARNVLLRAIAAFDGVDEALLLGPPDAGGPPLPQIDFAEIEEEVDTWIKGSLFLAREILSHFARRRAGVLAIVSQQLASAAAPLLEVTRSSFRGLGRSLARAYSLPSSSLMVNSFESAAEDAASYAAFVHRTLEERARKSSGRHYQHQSGLLSGLKRR